MQSISIRGTTFPLLCLLLLAATLSGCFEVREEVNMKEDGSGEMTVVFDLSKSKGKVKQYMKMESVEGYRVPSQAEIETLLHQAKTVIGKVDGITYVATKSDWSGFIFSVTARFDHIDALNTALVTLGRQMDQFELPAVPETNYVYRGEEFQRLYDFQPDVELYRQLPSIQRYMMETSHLISIYRFEKQIREFSHRKAMVSPSGKAIMLKIPLADLATGRGTLANTISFGG